jgi:hypothetical protein
VILVEIIIIIINIKHVIKGGKKRIKLLKSNYFEGLKLKKRKKEGN